jgi:hypothetical protein
MLTCVIAEDMRNTLDTFKQDLNSNLPRQVRTLIQQINGEAQGKRIKGSPMNGNSGTSDGQANKGVLANVTPPNARINLNLQQLFYQTMVYGPNIPPTENGVPHGSVPDVMFP